VLDEAYYIMGIKGDLEGTIYPAPIYFKIFNTVCSAHNIAYCSRHFNLLLLFLTGIVFFWTSRLFLGRYESLLCLSIYLLSGFSWYVNVVMPEILFGLITYLIVFILLKNYKLTIYQLILVALLTPLLIGVKNHGVFILPVLTIYIFIASPNQRFIRSISFFLLVCLLKASVDYYYYDEVRIFGKVYSQQLGMIKFEGLWKFAKDMSIAFVGILIFPFSIFYIPLFLLTKNLKNIIKDDRIFTSLFLTIGCVASIISITILYTYLVADEVSANTINRIEERYFAFGIPLLFLSSFILFKFYVKNYYDDKRTFIYYLLIALLSYFIINKYYVISYIDNPDINAIYGIGFLYFSILIAILTCIFFLLRDLKAWFICFSLCFVILCWVQCFQSYLFRKPDTPYDYAGKFICQNISSEVNLTVFVKDFVSYGFLYYQCPRPYKVKYFSEFDGNLTKNTIYVGTYVYNNSHKFGEANKINETIYYSKD